MLVSWFFLLLEKIRPGIVGDAMSAYLIVPQGTMEKSLDSKDNMLSPMIAN